MAEGEAEMIPRRPELHGALLDVARLQVDSHPGDYRRGPAYSWRDGGVVPEVEQLALDELKVCHLVVEIPARIADGVGAVLRLSPAGQQVLSQWDSQIPPASGPTVPVGVQPGAGEAQSEGSR